MSEMRLDKFLSEMGVGTRNEVKTAVKKGRASVNKKMEKKPERKIDLSKDAVEFDGKQILYAEFEYFMLNKPAGVVSAVTDSTHKTVLDFITEKTRKDLFPVGRLDIDTEGLLLITNDGELSHQLLSPKKHVDKVYYVKVDKPIPQDTRQRFLEGVDIKEGKLTLPAVLKQLEEKEAELTIHEGKYHQVKRMFEAVGCKVIYLKRISMGSLVLDPALKTGQYRSLTKEEQKQLKNAKSVMQNSL